MSWKFPKFPIKAGRLTDALDTDDNFLEFVEEVGGELNEHNWQGKAHAGAAKLQRTDVSRDDLFVWHSAGVARAGGGVPTTQGDFLDGPACGEANTVYLSGASSWSALAGTTVTFTSPNTLLWIHVSLQAVNDSPGAGGGTWWHLGTLGGTGRYDDTFSNLLIGIAVDDYLIPESVVGGAEPSNDRNYGVMMGSMPLATSMVYPVTPGEHTVSLFVRVAPKLGSVIGGSNGIPQKPEEIISDGSGTGSWDGIGIHFEHREIVVLEMRR